MKRNEPDDKYSSTLCQNKMIIIASAAAEISLLDEERNARNVPPIAQRQRSMPFHYDSMATNISIRKMTQHLKFKGRPPIQQSRFALSITGEVSMIRRAADRRPMAPAFISISRLLAPPLRQQCFTPVDDIWQLIHVCR